jgi:GNAT superfamily N-acetyltransferase
MDWNIRPADASDAHTIAVVHVESWKTTYKDIFPDSLLSNLTVEKRESSWKETLTSPEPRSVTLVACNADGVVGFVSGGSERGGLLGYDGELYAIYLLHSVQRQGLGKLLMTRFASALNSTGFQSMAVWVLAANPSKRFYEILGGEPVSERKIDRGGQSFLEVAYGWKDLSKFGASHSIS